MKKTNSLRSLRKRGDTQIVKRGAHLYLIVKKGTCPKFKAKQ